MYKRILKIDKQRRLNIPRDLMELVSIKPADKLAICSCEERKMFLRSPENVQENVVFGIMKVDDKGRIILPKFSPDFHEVEIFALEGDLYIIPTDDPD